MEINFDNFKEIKKGVPAGQPIVPWSGLRINVTSMSMGTSRLDLNALKSDEGEYWLTFFYSEPDKAFLVRKGEPGIGYKFALSKAGHTLALNMVPIPFQKLGVARGVYKPIPDNPYVFVLTDEDFAEEEKIISPKTREEKYATEPHIPGTGDIVAYVIRGGVKDEATGKYERFGTGKATICTGVVEKVINRKEDGEVFLDVRAISNFMVQQRGNDYHSIVKATNVIVREK